jgi:GT2 family glycosyltransferase
MPILSDLLRTAGNVFLTPLDLADIPNAGHWRRALLSGSSQESAVTDAADALRRIAPDITTEVMGQPGAPRTALAARRRRYDVACLMLTGEGGRREKLAAALAGAEVIVARGASGQWYQVHLPALRPLSGRWWARTALAGLLSLLYLCVLAKVRASDTLWRLAPMRPPIRDPGPAVGRRVTFIVPTYNQRQLMDFCLPLLLAEAGRVHEVMVVDDASEDGTAEYVRRQYPSVRVLRLERNQGFAGAVRAGIAASITPFFALINTDVQVRSGFLQAILPHFDREDTFAVCSRIELPGGSQMETGNVAPAFPGILEPYHLPPDHAGPILYAGGASSVYHRGRYDALGGFETIFRPLYWEDIELGYRAWRRGWRSLFEPLASVWHQRRAWIGTRFGEAYANQAFLKNALVFIWKNVRDGGMLAQHWAYVTARLYREAPSGDGTMCRALLAALPMLPAVLRRRWRERRRGDLDDRDILALATPPGAGEST